jgi:hypothetical protein
MVKLARMIWVAAAVGLLLAACGRVSDGTEIDAATGANGNGNGNGDGNGNGQADGGPECPGDVDDDGACVCAPREAGVICDECAPRWTAPETGCTEFFDDFNRSSGPLGEGWGGISLPIAEEALIVNGRACGDVQSVAFLAETIEATSLTASFSFESANEFGLEVAFLFSPDDDLSTVYIAGCDGGGEVCTLKIGRLTQTFAETEVPAFGAGTRYDFELDLDDGEVQIRIFDGPTEIASVDASIGGGLEIRRFGFITGRESDGALSCIDDFTLTVR